MYVFALLGCMLDDLSEDCTEFYCYESGERIVLIPPCNIQFAVRSIVQRDFSTCAVMFEKKGGRWKITTIECNGNEYDVTDEIESCAARNYQDDMYYKLCEKVAELGMAYA